LAAQAGGKIAAAATTGPASGPRPASSTPATRVMPCSHKDCSNLKLLDDRAMLDALQHALHPIPGN
jgi:hypothetical protein